MTRRVAVTGLGVVSALGPDAGAYRRALHEATGGIAPIEALDTSRLRITLGGEARDFDPLAHFPEKRLTFLDRFAQLAVVAAREAVADAGVAWEGPAGERVAVATGSAMGGKATEDAAYARLYGDRASRVSPLLILRSMANAGASEICLDLGLTGPAYTFSTACSSSAHAIGHAFWLVRGGMADGALAGGSDAPFAPGVLKAWEAMRVVAPDACRPFARDRCGMSLGEGAAMLVLEPLEAARARGARVYAEIAGFGMTSDAHHLTQPSIDGPARAMRAALDDGGLEPERIGYINAHGTGTPVNDRMEVAAVRSVFGAAAEQLAISSTKSAHGHALGAAGALEAVATVLAIRDGVLPATLNHTAPDPECDLDVVPNVPRRAEVDGALSSSFAFGGLNAVLAFGRAA
jgi:nodulation protein E